jgi:Protein of unknown function (DUF3082)
MRGARCQNVEMRLLFHDPKSTLLMPESPPLAKSSLTTPAKKVTPLSCFTGAMLSGTLGLLIYRLTTAIAQSFAAHPAPTSQPLTYNLSVAVRTLVVGMTTLGAGIFTLAAVGLLGLGIKLLLGGQLPPASPDT